MEDIVRALAEQHSELARVLVGLDEQDWLRPSRCAGWDVTDVLLHLAQTHEMAIATVLDQVAAAADEAGFLPADGGALDTVDGAAAAAVALQRTTGYEIAQRWYKAADELVDVLRACDPSKRVVWVSGRLSARTLAATRLSEAWIHTGDIADAFGVAVPPTDRLRHIARLAWRTIPYAFARANRELSGPVAFHLVGPNGHDWHFDPDEPAATTIAGAAVELCLVAARRVDPSDTSLRGAGPDVSAVLELVRTYAL
ncbi:MAG: maleylpyruvate isomerase family mycothiol-dependent enzyme [Actinomycetota bacterium]